MALAGQLFAPHYARAMFRTALAGATAVYSAPSADSETVASLASGDMFGVLDVSGGWAWGYLRSGHLVGYVPASLLEGLG